MNKNGRLNNYNFNVIIMNDSSNSCDCHDEQHKGKKVNHIHTEYECVQEYSSRHKLHQPEH